MRVQFVPAGFFLQYGTSGPLAPIMCPYCGEPLNWAPDQWLAAFECRRCGPFSDFGSSPLAHRNPSALTASRYRPTGRATGAPFPGGPGRDAVSRRRKAQRARHGVIATLELDILHDARIFAGAADLLQRGSIPGTTSPPPHRARSVGFINASASAGSFPPSRRFHTGSVKEPLTFL